MKRVFALLLLAVMLLSACTAGENPGGDIYDPSGSSEPSSDPAVESSSTAPTETTATEPPLLYQNPLNGTPLADPWTLRPVAVMLNNHEDALPQHSVGQADILYEVLAEYGITRCMGIYSDISLVGDIGSIRSARQYFVELARGYDDLPYVHCGGSHEALAYLKNLKKMDLDQMKGGKHFYWSQDRMDAGFEHQHSLFTTGEKLLNYMAAKEMFTEYEQEQDYKLNFDDSTMIVGEAKTKLKVYFNLSSAPDNYTKTTSFVYDEATKLYYASQRGGEYVDGNNNQQIAFRNVLVLRTKTWKQADNILLSMNTTGSGTGYFACNGQLVPIRWSRSSVKEPMTYTLENGMPLTLGVGKTYIAVVPTNAAFKSE